MFKSPTTPKRFASARAMFFNSSWFDVLMAKGGMQQLESPE